MAEFQALSAVSKGACNLDRDWTMVVAGEVYVYTKCEGPILEHFSNGPASSRPLAVWGTSLFSTVAPAATWRSPRHRTTRWTCWCSWRGFHVDTANDCVSETAATGSFSFTATNHQAPIIRVQNWARLAQEHCGST